MDEEAEMELFQLLVVGDAARRGVERSLEHKHGNPAKADRPGRRTVRVRSFSAAALRSLADRLEPSPTV
jgi:hypothetical protein